MELSNLLAFAVIALGMALTPGPNMAYLVSRSISQGRAAGLISLGGVALGFVFYMLCAAFASPRLSLPSRLPMKLSVSPEPSICFGLLGKQCTLAVAHPSK